MSVYICYIGDNVSRVFYFEQHAEQWVSDRGTEERSYVEWPVEEEYYT